MVQLPPGFRFRPTEEQLLHGYLLKKVRGEALPCDIVTDCEIYGERDKEPWKIFDENSTEKFYVFTQLKKKNPNGKRIERKAGIGSWKGQRTDFVKDSNNNHIGFKKPFVFEVKNPSSSNINKQQHWLMTEYSLVNDLSGYVLCEIRNKNSNSSARVDEQVEDEDEDYEIMAEDQQVEDEEYGITAEELEEMLSDPEIQPFSYQQNNYFTPVAALSY
ncbi:No apical meristem (NAM) protein [Corchorus capsularis]|uniref:No apical meristem (NAM) protein n=1 Tax=Corchorus capsularis TaxID=210143 RepID=A0A1R3HG05_COCAP|nr:No apical meristem (NAM) protein [Corchorus capsularis]